MPTRIKIRGIYSTALTKFALDSGFQVVDPSAKIRERFPQAFADEDYDILLQDRDDLQGIKLKGEADRLCQILTLMQESFLDAIITSFLPVDEDETLVVADLELPGASKERLDQIRAGVVPTLRNHHRMKIIDSDLLEEAEKKLAAKPRERLILERELWKQAVLMPLQKEGTVRLEHIRPSGKPMRPREGIIEIAKESKVAFKRSFSRGRYDGLNLPIRNGDYGLTEIRDGDWFIKHKYYSREHLLIGEYYNVNTPVELYPYGARYVDLEVDVIRRAGEDAFAVDREKLDILSRKGCIGKDLYSKALLTTEQMLRSLNRKENKT